MPILAVKTKTQSRRRSTRDRKPPARFGAENNSIQKKTKPVAKKAIPKQRQTVAERELECMILDIGFSTSPELLQPTTRRKERRNRHRLKGDLYNIARGVDTFEGEALLKFDGKALSRFKDGPLLMTIPFGETIDL